MGTLPRTHTGRVSMGPEGRGRWAQASDLSSLLILIPLLFRMEWAAGERGRDPRGQPGPWELRVGLLLSGERAWGWPGVSGR